MGSMNDKPGVDDNSPSLSNPKNQSSQQEPQLGGDAAVLHLVQCLDHEHHGVRYSAALALGKIGDQRAIQVLIEMIDNYLTDEEIVHALAKIGDPALNALADLLGHRNWYASHQAALELARMGKLGITKLIQLSKSDDPQIHWLAIIGLEQVGYPHNTPSQDFIDAFTFPHPLLHDFVVRALAKRNDPSVIPLLRGLVHDKNAPIRLRRIAASVFAFMGSLEGIDILLDVGPSLTGPSTAYMALLSLGEKAFPYLIPELEGDNWHAIDALRDMNIPQVVPALEQALKEQSARGRNNAAFILGIYADPHSVPYLIAALSDEDSRVQHTAAQSLTDIGTPAALEAVEAWNRQQDE
jgi:HEAT repeat protein